MGTMPEVTQGVELGSSMKKLKKKRASWRDVADDVPSWI